MGSTPAAVLNGNPVFCCRGSARYGPDCHQWSKSVLSVRFWYRQTNGTKYMAPRPCKFRALLVLVPRFQDLALTLVPALHAGVQIL
jgi:hypothetical protein